MRSLELRIPPSFVAIIAAVLMWLLARIFPSTGFSFPAPQAVMFGFVVVGAVLTSLAVTSLRRVGTTLHPQRPGKASTLVTSGVYSWTRNPMYLGLLLGLLGWVIRLSNFGSILMLPLFVVYLNRYQIGPEERLLAVLFGQKFTAYRSRVRRWI